MAQITNRYAQRKWLRRLEAIVSKLEQGVNRITTVDFNPLYHLGTFSTYLLIVITVTGLYLTIFYRPGASVAYETVEQISSGWFGSLMRTVHRYASDAFLLVAIVHAIKTFVSDRFWGGRWLAWVSGWALVVLSWLIGTMGYWLVWDQRAQWLTEYLINNVGGAVALTFVGADIVTSTFVIFVIVLFVHIFLPLALLVLIIFHLLRMARPRVWSPKWVLVWSTVGMVLVSVFAPAVSAEPADLSRFISRVGLDGWYLGFLPLIDRYGGGVFWGITSLVFGAAVLAPWLSKGKDNGPAVIEEPECTGCALCSSECPYRAIEMHYRDDDVSRFKSIAVINESLCTGCGLCVGTCATMGVDMAYYPSMNAYDDGVLAAAKQVMSKGGKPTILFLCERQASLGSAPIGLTESSWDAKAGDFVEGRGFTSEHPVARGEWGLKSGENLDVLTCSLPCIGMVDVVWVKELVKLGVEDVVLLSCQYDDCNYREGPRWTGSRLNRRKQIITPNLHWTEAAPGDWRSVETFFEQNLGTKERTKPVMPDFGKRQRMMPKRFIMGMVLLLFTVVTALAIPAEFEVGSTFVDMGQIRIGLEHPGVVMSGVEGLGVALPEGAQIDEKQLMGGVARHPVSIQLQIDGAVVLEREYEPKGLRNEGEINGVATYLLEPGTYRVEVWMDDDGEGLRLVYAEDLTVARSQIETLVYDRESGDVIKLGTE